MKLSERTGFRTAVLFLFLSAVLYWIGFSMVRPMVALYFGSAGYSAPVIGLLLAMHAFIPVLFAMPAGSLIDRIGSRQAVRVGSVVLLFSGVCYGLGGMYHMLWPMILGQICSGLGSLFSWGALQASAAQTSRGMENAARKDHLLANFAFVNSLAQFGGPLAGGVLSDWAGYTTVFLIYSGIALISVTVSHWLPKAKRNPTDPSAGEKHGMPKPADNAGRFSFSFVQSYGSGIALMKQNKPFTMAIFINGVLFILIDIQGTFFPLYLANLGLTNTQVGLMLSTGAVASVLIRPLVGYLVRWLGHEKIMVMSLAIGAGCLISLMFEPVLGLLVVIVFVWGACSGVNQPMALIMVARTVASEKQGMGMSLRTMSNRTVQVVNPVVFGALSGAIGLTFGFGAVGFMLIGFAAFFHHKFKIKSPSRAVPGRQPDSP